MITQDLECLFKNSCYIMIIVSYTTSLGTSQLSSLLSRDNSKVKRSQTKYSECRKSISPREMESGGGIQDFGKEEGVRVT